MPNVLATTSRLVCPHLGQVDVTAAPHSAVGIGEHAHALRVDDRHPVRGCAFMQGNKPSPCVIVEWSAGSGTVTVGGVAVLTEASVGTCKSGEGAAQGVVTVQDTPASVRA